MSSFLLRIYTYIYNKYTYTRSLLCMYLQIFGRGLPLPFFLKEGDALGSYESRTSSQAEQPQAVLRSMEGKARSPALLPARRQAARSQASGCLRAGLGGKASLTAPQPTPSPPGGRG